MTDKFGPSDEHVSAVARTLSDVRAQRDRIVHLGQALSSGILKTGLDSAAYAPQDAEALKTLTTQLESSVNARTSTAAARIASVLNDIGNAVVDDIVETAARVRILREMVIRPPSASAHSGEALKSTTVIDGEASVVDAKPSEDR